jgi:uncharacterized membrane protein
MQRVEKSVRVGVPIERAYNAWRSFENFPHFMDSVEDIRVKDPAGKLSHWRLKKVLGMNIEYDAELSEDDPNRSIGWRSVGDGSIGTSGNVTFTETDNGETLVHVILQWFDPPAGPIGEAMSHMLQNPASMLEDDLRRFKRWVESSGARTVAA